MGCLAAFPACSLWKLGRCLEKQICPWRQRPFHTYFNRRLENLRRSWALTPQNCDKLKVQVGWQREKMKKCWNMLWWISKSLQSEQVPAKQRRYYVISAGWERWDGGGTRLKQTICWYSSLLPAKAECWLPALMLPVPPDTVLISPGLADSLPCFCSLSFPGSTYLKHWQFFSNITR